MSSQHSTSLRNLYDNLYTLNCKNGLWLKVERIQIPLIPKIGLSPYLTYVYMCSWVITDINSKRGTWKQIASKYFTDKKLLPFCKNEINIANDMGMDKSQTKRNIQKLVDSKFIIYQDSISLSKHNRKKAKIYTVGTWSESQDEMGNKKRIFDFSIYELSEKEKSKVDLESTSNTLISSQK